ncbi:MAG: Thiopurine S-methyltransferase [Marinobacterium sp. xm-d-530]|jgi:2-polyprenyl-3-methyl-5-hydroxy-6-metoxy-1,4-benzoquinol methylase|uniref:class I SAM-dependent methyltransferase n=1 Tax=Marinobacterium sp. xm-d-530 TaxID=2497747 RepID=UPI0015686C64|nr:class I SAM-dependent methyltransferase [Marinobacterium sp. xm-d-530]NRQ02164.1 Thiopurine S-methyltransferase [Marinobacterium sp. xm-d-530]CAI8225814.1 MAG: Thiopurine S-methyltransferase [Marinobacterium sp. xm-d-530]
MKKLKLYWNERYQSLADEELSWTEVRPDLSLEWIEKLADRDDSIIDIGGGRSALIASLLGQGYTQLTHLDLSSVASRELQERLGEKANQINWICGSVLDFSSAATIDVWHDRAVFHFLTKAKDRQQYVKVLEQHLSPEGRVILATFHTSGPKKCSGLPICQYTSESLVREFNQWSETDWELELGAINDHVTPSGNVQVFQYSSLRKSR